MKTRKLFVKFEGKWCEVQYIKNGKPDYSRVQFIISKYNNGKPLCSYVVPLHCCSNIKFKKVKEKNNVKN